MGGWLFGNLPFVAFTRVYVAFVAFHFAFSGFTVPLCLAFVAFSSVYVAFAALAFCILYMTNSSGGFLALVFASCASVGFLDRDLIAPLFESSFLGVGWGGVGWGGVGWGGGVEHHVPPPPPPPTPALVFLGYL